MPASIFGRDPELASVREFLDGVRGAARAMVIAGDPGIGKTTVWLAGVELARSNSFRVLVANPAEGEAKLSYVALGDLLGGVLDDVVSDLPTVQSQALEVALLRAEAKGALQQRAVATAFLGAVTALAREHPVIVAVDDVQWLDRASAQVLSYAVRRLTDEPVGFFLASRKTPSGLLDSLPEDQIRLELGPLTLGALHHVIRDRLGRTLRRPFLIRVAASSGGNPFYALEMARALQDSDVPPAAGEGLPIPETLKQLLVWRLRALSDDARDFLLVASAMAHPTIGALGNALGDEVDAPLEEAEGRGWSISPEPMSDSAIRCLHPSCTGLHRRRRDGASIAGSRRWSPIRRSGHAISRSARSSRTRSSPPCSRRPQVSPARGVRPMPPPSSAICRLALRRPRTASLSLAEL